MFRYGYFERVLAAVISLPLLCLLYFYLIYAGNAWFFQDDFGFLVDYGSSVQWGQLVDFSNFGRFLSRNLYWFVMHGVFGAHADYYFVMSLALIMCSASLLWLVAGRLYGWYFGFFASVTYILLPSTIASYAWLSNVQHLLGHFFVFAFLALYAVRSSGQSGGLTWSQLGGLIVLYIAGMSSNIFVGLVLSLVVLEAVTNPACSRDRRHWLLIVVGAVIFAIFVVGVSQNKSEAYKLSLNLDSLVQNAKFYFGSVNFALAWILICFSGFVFGLGRRQAILAWFFMASVVFYLPYAFMQHQRYIQYGALTYIFFIVGLGIGIKEVLGDRFYRIAAFIGMLLVLLVFRQSAPLMSYFTDNPWGAKQADQVNYLKAEISVLQAGAKDVCFDAGIATNSKGVAEWSIPEEWWFIGFGKAYTLFVDPTRRYGLQHEMTHCDINFIFHSGRLVRAR